MQSNDRTKPHHLERPAIVCPVIGLINGVLPHFLALKMSFDATEMLGYV